MAGYTPFPEVLTCLQERAEDWLGTFVDFGPDLIARLNHETQEFLTSEIARENSWKETTTNDRITGAFAELRDQGVFAAECLGHTI